MHRIVANIGYFVAILRKSNNIYWNTFKGHFRYVAIFEIILSRTISSSKID